MSTGRNLGSASFRKFFEKLKDDGFWDTRTRTITYPFLSSYTRSKWDGSGTGRVLLHKSIVVHGTMRAIAIHREALSVARVVAAMIGLSIILLLGVLDWDDCLSEILAWDTLACLAEIELPYFTTEITSPSSPFALSLTKHLQSIGAKMYGAFWCSHYLEQKQVNLCSVTFVLEADLNHEVNTIEKLMFGSEAAKLLNYVECFPDGYKKGTKILKACANAGIEGFPTWVINRQVLRG
ncbi:hypothetical protein FEM48_Zijuj09G0227100 [Ziziphus jujuba var. spinosa]|uniref:Uncharacterized protein n=1 Tax=Ziziphus jujuba var. spinosa TaxID=714518 RepID=A0A978UVR2_ZIZJJ|nr:hypothetical protein FEM48_Zijuj09G0227100 [Ziziphus jujuba var. spinosa]